ncbi:MAG: dihydrofolate reductase [Cellvibrionaceae bacterium]|jgi:dihydrofolate reductase
MFLDNPPKRSAPKLSIIVAMANNRTIGKNNQLIWHLPEDLKYFKRVTMGKPLVMGRKTFESIGRPLPGRLNIVITRQRDWRFSGVDVVHSLEQARKLAEAQANVDKIDEIMVIGGEQVYCAALPIADRIYLTRVETEVAGDAFFPPIDRELWKEVSREQHFASSSNPYDYTFCVLQKRS